MKRVKNLIENKGLINTFNKQKIGFYLNKAFSKKSNFYFLKYKDNNLLRVVFLKKNKFFKSNQVKKDLSLIKISSKTVFNVIFMFITLYFYKKI